MEHRDDKPLCLRRKLGREEPRRVLKHRVLPKSGRFHNLLSNPLAKVTKPLARSELLSEGEVAGQHGVKDNSKRPHVGSGSVVPTGLKNFWSDVKRRSNDGLEHPEG
jgi:hypothetical protein